MAFERVLGRTKSRRVAHPKVLLGSRKVTLMDSEKVEVGGMEAMVLYDKGSDITLVSSAFVQRQGIKGRPATGIVEAGLPAGSGEPVQILAAHELPVRCGLGPMKTLTAYEVSNIGRSTKDLDPMIKVGLFPDGPHDFTVQKGTVDVLLGSDNLEFHPIVWEERAGLTLSRSRIGGRKMIIAGRVDRSYYTFA